MNSVSWSAFTKEELVEILDELGDREYPLTHLWKECDVFYAKDCTCAPLERSLPSRVIAIRDRALARLQKSRLRRESPLRKLLRSPFQRVRDQTRSA